MHIPKIFRDVPEQLKVADVVATEVEVSRARELRKPFLMPGQPDEYMVDIVRAFRLVSGRTRYVEVGTRDRGNIAYTASLLAPNPTIVDIDIDRFEVNEKLIAKHLSGRANYSFIHGDSVAPKTIERVKAHLGGEGADVIFCDSSHLYEHTLAEFDNYFGLVKKGGFLMFHDALWEGNHSDKGKHQALLAIDRYLPVFVVHMNTPVHRIISHSSKSDIWGAVAIIQKH